jgi:hypothetical protein
LSVPVAFQYPEAAALFGLAPLGYFLSRGLKKYHSRSPKIAFPVAIFHIMDRLHNLQTKTIPPYTNKAKLEVNSDKQKKEKSEIKTYKEPILRFVLTPNLKIKVISKSQIFKYAKLCQSSKSISLDLIFGLSIPQNHHRIDQFLLQRSTDYGSKPTRQERSEITSF